MWVLTKDKVKEEGTTSAWLQQRKVNTHYDLAKCEALVSIHAENLDYREDQAKFHLPQFYPVTKPLSIDNTVIPKYQYLGYKFHRVFERVQIP